VISSGSGYGSPPPLLTAISNNNNNNSPRKTIPAPMERNAAAAMTAIPQGRVFASMSERTSCATAAAAGVRGSPLVLSSGTFNRRLTATLSPEECKMMFTHTEKVSKFPLFYSKTYSASLQMLFVSCEPKKQCLFNVEVDYYILDFSDFSFFSHTKKYE
jgi:hypothetical protein